MSNKREKFITINIKIELNYISGGGMTKVKHKYLQKKIKDERRLK